MYAYRQYRAIIEATRAIERTTLEKIAEDERASAERHASHPELFNAKGYRIVKRAGGAK